MKIIQSLLPLLLGGIASTGTGFASETLSANKFFNQTESGYSLDFDGSHYRSLSFDYNGQKIPVRAFEKIVYV